MTRQPCSNRRVLHICQAGCAILTFAVLIALSPAARAATLAEQAHSLNKVPADTAFYSASLRLKEQWDAFTGSKAHAKLMEIPLFQMMKMQIGFYWQQSTEPTMVKIRDYLESPEGKDATSLLHEMFADEVFVYGGNDIAASFKVFMEINAAQRAARLEAMAKGEDANELTAEQVLDVLEKHPNEVKVPTFVLGFRIKDAERAKRELDEVHSLIRNALDARQPELAAHLQRDQIGGHEFLTLRLDGSMIPWEKVREEAENIDDEQFAKWRKVLSGKTLAVALGIVDEFVLVAIGDSTDNLEHIGQGPFLAQQPALKPLEKHADQRLVSIGYMSKAFAQSLSSPQQTMEDIAAQVEQTLGDALGKEHGDKIKEHRKEIAEDIRSLDLARYMPQPGEMAGVTFLTGRGYEGFRYSSAKQPMMDSSKPLSILKHVGGNPALVIASRLKESLEDYDRLVEWLKRTATHVEKIVEETADADDWAQYQKYRDRAVELLKRIDVANREHLFPALDGQSAFVLDFAAKNKQWFREMPESPKPLPMVEVAMVSGVSDAEHLRKGVREYIGVVREGIKLAGEIDSDMPQPKLPKAEPRDIDGTKLYVFPLPKKWGIDEHVAPNAGLSDKFAVASGMPDTSTRLLREAASEIDTSLPLDRPAALVAHIEFKQIIAAIRPWIDYGMDVAMGKLKLKKDEDEADKADENTTAEQSAMIVQFGFVVPQIQQFLDFASAMRSATSITYEEDGTWVTHSETHIEDLK
jgi:hypothetical protein